MTRLRYNGLSTTLGGSLTSSGTSVTFAAALTHSGGTAVPTITGTDYIPLSILDSTGRLSEIVYLTAYTSGATTGTITRGQEGTTGVTHASGDKVDHGVTATDVTDVTGGGYSRIYAPETGSTTVDEFNADTLDAAWVRVDTSGGAGRVTWRQGGGVLFASSAGGDASAELHALMRSFTGTLASGDGFETCFTITGPYLTNFVMTGLVLANGVTSGAGTQVTTLNYAINSSGVIWQDSSVVTETNYTTQGTYGGGLKTAPYMRTFQRLTYRGANQWRQDISIDGVTWIKGALYTQALTPTYVGLFISSWGTATAGTSNFEYLRRVTGVA